MSARHCSASIRSRRYRRRSAPGFAPATGRTTRASASRSSSTRVRRHHRPRRRPPPSGAFGGFGGLTLALPISTGGEESFTRIGRLTIPFPGGERSLGAYWMAGYAGGLFVPFRDATNGAETYGAGRYLLDTAKSADLGPGAAPNSVVLDFNFAFHPSCAFDPKWSCPLALAGEPPRHSNRGGRAPGVNDQARIRAAAVADAPEIARVRVDSWRAAYAGHRARTASRGDGRLDLRGAAGAPARRP